jgi:hypothetical protein
MYPRVTKNLMAPTDSRLCLTDGAESRCGEAKPQQPAFAEQRFVRELNKERSWLGQGVGSCRESASFATGCF